MNTIYTGEAYEILPLPNGIIYSYKREELEGGNNIVSYKMISFENGVTTDAGRNIYLISKFGNNYREIVKHCKNFVLAKSVMLPGGRVLIINEDNEAVVTDDEGEIVWTGDFAYRGSKPSDVVAHNSCLWASYKESNAIIKYNLSNMREELRIGGVRTPFNKPGDLYIEGDDIVVCNQGDNSIVSVNLKSYSVEKLYKFEEPIKQYVSVKKYRFVLLESGIYLV